MSKAILARTGHRNSGESRMKKKTMKYQSAMIIAISLLAVATSLSAGTRTGYALPQSSKVALVPDKFGLHPHGGSVPTSGFPGGFAPTFTDLDPNSIKNDPIDPITAGGYDTVVLVMMDYIQDWLSDATFKGRIDDFVFNGGKLIIWDSENTHNDYSTFVFSHLPEGNLAFDVSTPGQQGAWSGDLWIVENNTLGTNDTASQSYVNTATFHDNIDIGDANVMVTSSPEWCSHMVALNVYGVQGPVQTYARYGNGLIIYNGLDIDYMDDGQVIDNDNNAVHNLGYIWYLHLLQKWDPDDLPCKWRTSGLTLSPHNSTNLVGTMHTVVASVTTNLTTPVPNVTVTFTIVSGPNAGMTGMGITNATGQTPFSWTSANTGTDTINATAPCPFRPNVTIYDTATKTWTPPPMIPVFVDIKPGSWPNPLNIKSKGVVPVALCGTEEFDVTTVDPETIQLTREGLGVGVSPLRWSFEDVATPYVGEPGGGHDLEADGYLDLTLKLSTQELVNTLGLEAYAGMTIPLVITGNLRAEFDGTPIQGQDNAWILMLSMHLSSTSVARGSTLTISGKLTPAPEAPTSIYLYVRSPHQTGSWKIVTTVNTCVKGSYSITATVPMSTIPGYCDLVAVWLTCTETYVTSPIITITIT